MTLKPFDYVHYGSVGNAECGAENPVSTTVAADVSCPTCQGWLPIVAPELQKPRTDRKYWTWRDVGKLSPQQVADALNELERLREVNARRVVRHLSDLCRRDDEAS